MKQSNMTTSHAPSGLANAGQQVLDAVGHNSSAFIQMR